MKIDVTLKAKKMGLNIQNISDQTHAKLSNAIASVSKMAYSQGVSYVQQRLNKTRTQYLTGFHYSSVGKNIYLIHLDDELDYLEDGYDKYDMKPGLLNGPKSRRTVDGKGRYNIIPFFHSPQSQAPMSKAQQGLQLQLQQVIKENRLDKTFKDPITGKPLQGVVARLGSKGMPKNLAGMVKIQKTYAKKTGSMYLTFRVVSTKSKPSSWWHPGYKGAHVFRDLEGWTSRKIDEVLKQIL